MMEPHQPAADPLVQSALRPLNDITVPPPVSWMPQTWGWALVALVIAVLIATAIFYLLRRYHANAWLRQALTLLDGIEEKIRNPATRQDGIRQLAELIKRAALVEWNRPDVAALSGAAWVHFLAEHDDQNAAQTLRAILEDGEYRDVETLQDTGSELISAAHRWIGRHHVSA